MTGYSYHVLKLQYVCKYFLLEETTTEVCDEETFTARCPYSQNVFITRAIYGHIRIGRCIGMDFGFLGCYADVKHMLETSCARKQRCSLPIDEEMKSTKSCPKGLVKYLEVSYTCIPGSFYPLHIQYKRLQ